MHHQELNLGDFQKKPSNYDDFIDIAVTQVPRMPASLTGILSFNLGLMPFCVWTWHVSSGAQKLAC